jgi:bifunctional DNA-binding transcriptional regulator/antitoxin component of YhaV-PrlF toxin-antitoxin module
MTRKTRMKVDENGRVVIPASFRKPLGILVGNGELLEAAEKACFDVLVTPTRIFVISKI